MCPCTQAHCTSFTRSITLCTVPASNVPPERMRRRVNSTTPRLRCTRTRTYIRIRAHLLSIIGYSGAGPWLQQNWQSVRVRPLPSATGKTREMQPLLSLHRLNFLYSPFSTVESGRCYPCIFGPLLCTPPYNAHAQLPCYAHSSHHDRQIVQFSRQFRPRTLRTGFFGEYSNLKYYRILHAKHTVWWTKYRGNSRNLQEVW